MAGVSGARHVALLAALLSLVLVTGADAARVPSGMLAKSKDGWITLAFVAAPNMPVTFTETTGGVTEPIRTVTTDARGYAPVEKARAWRCDRLVRTFAAHGVASDGEVYDGTYDVKTPSCATRLALTVPRHVDRNHSFGVRMSDRFRLGDIDVDLCVDGAGIRHRCYSVLLPGRAGGTVRRFTARRSGHVRVAVRLYRTSTVRTVAVGRARPATNPGAPVVLATGDSTIMGIDSFLADRLGSGGRVVSDFHVGTGITTPGETSWKAFATRQSRRFHPDVTVISVGANEGYPFGDTECCDTPWVTKYATYLRALMDRYQRDGAAHVAWLTLPIPQDDRRAAITRAVNRAIFAAAAGQKGVVVVDLVAVFTPDGRFRQSMTYEGRSVRVREDDGLHLSVAGTKIAADAALKAIRTTDWLRGT